MDLDYKGESGLGRDKGRVEMVTGEKGCDSEVAFDFFPF